MYNEVRSDLCLPETSTSDTIDLHMTPKQKLFDYTALLYVSMWDMLLQFSHFWKPLETTTVMLVWYLITFIVKNKLVDKTLVGNSLVKVAQLQCNGLYLKGH